ncbi:MAG: hypothetical protein ABWX94_03845 [Candidatus Saccharimonadales bacterium]
MTISALPSTGNSSKFHVVSKNGEFNLALSFTLRTKIWQLPDPIAELSAATELAEAIVSRHNPKLPFKELYVFAEHNTLADYAQTVSQIRKNGF